VSPMDAACVAAIMRSSLREATACFNREDSVLVENRLSEMRLVYVCRQASCDPQDVTRMECRIHSDSREVWIGALQVASMYRLRGLGRQLALAVERMACRLDLDVINVFPLASAQRFWENLGYRPHPSTVRVFVKRPEPGSSWTETLTPKCFVRIAG
jgi:GNAT superfamily N-acetyltransferase